MRLAMVFLTCSLITLISGCNSYTLETAKKNGDLIVGFTEKVDYGKIEKFMNDVEHKRESSIRITSFTEEGDLILQDLHYDKQQIQYTYDNSRDEYGGKHKGKYKTECNNIEKKVVVAQDDYDREDYILTECEKIIGTHNPDENEIYLLSKPM